MVWVPGPAVDGVKIAVTGLTPAPEYVPPRGNPPLSRKGLALTVVTVSKQVVKVTSAEGMTVIDTGLEVAGLFEVQRVLEEVTTQSTWSPSEGV